MAKVYEYIPSAHKSGATAAIIPNREEASVTRTSDGYSEKADGTLELKGANETRYYYDNGVRKILIEDSATNLEVNSDSVSNANSVSSTISSLDSPDPTKKSTEIKGLNDSTPKLRFRYRFVNIPVSNESYVGSVFVKKGLNRYFQLSGFGTLSNQQYCNFDLENGTIVKTDGADVQGFITPYANGWYRVGLKMNADNTGNGAILLGVIDTEQSNWLPPSVYNEGDLLYYWFGVSLVQEETMSSYISTGNTPETRTADTLNDNTSLTLSRTSQAYRTNKDGLLELMDANVPRIDYSDDLNCPSLLLESQATNLESNTEDIKDGATIGSRTSIQESTLNSPNISVKAQDVIANGDGSAFRYKYYNGFTLNKNYVGSLFAKKGDYRYIQLSGFGSLSNQQYCNFDLDNGTVVKTDGLDVEGFVIPYANGWYRIGLKMKADSTGNGSLLISAIDTEQSGWLPSLSNSNNLIYHWWGINLVEGDTLSSYIPNSFSSGTSTRTADTNVQTGDISQYLNQSEGMMEVDLLIRDSSDLVGFALYNNNFNYIYVRSQGLAFRTRVLRGGGNLGLTESDRGTLGQVNNFKIAWDANGVYCKLNGVEYYNKTSTGTFTLERIIMTLDPLGLVTHTTAPIKSIKIYDSINDY